MMELHYRRQKAAAKFRGIDWLFTFETWVAVWESSGHLHERGMGRGRYVMARYGDVGPYSPENVEIVLHEKNARDSRLNHRNETSAAGRKSLGRGRGWSLRPSGYQVSVAKTYVGTYPTQQQAEDAYCAAVAARAAKFTAGSDGDRRSV